MFYHSKLPMNKIVKIMYYFASTTPTRNVQEFCGVSEKAVTEWYGIYRGYCSKEMIDCNMVVSALSCLFFVVLYRAPHMRRLVAQAMLLK